MSDQIAVIGTDARSEIVKPGVWGVGIFLGIFMFLLGFNVEGVVTGFIGLVGTVLAVVGGVGYVYINTRYAFYQDRVEVDSPVGTAEVEYDEVAFALRTSDDADAEYNTADFTLVRADEDPLSMPNALKPDVVEQVLEEQLPTAAEWIDGHGEQHTALDAFVRPPPTDARARARGNGGKGCARRIARRVDGHRYERGSGSGASRAR